jgi:NADH-quinone oxidoreductase subunit G
MVASPRAGYLVAGVEAELDMGPAALAAIAQSEFSVVLSAYRNATTERGHVMLPIAPFTETPGTFVNMEGRVQSFNAMVKPQGDARQGWKVLRMLGSMLGLAGFEAERVEEVRADISPAFESLAEGRLSNAVDEFDWQLQAAPQSLERVDEFAIYAMDPVARRSRPVQLTADMKRARSARYHPATAASLELAEGDRVRVRQGNGEALLTVAFDASVPEGCVRVARGIAETAALGEGAVEVEKLAMAAVA